MRAYSKPMIVTAMGAPDEQCLALERLPLIAKSKEAPEALYNEHWLQMLIQRNPTLLPVDQIEPALTPLVPICVELPVPSGFVDNLLLTPDGGIAVVEAKLWRNGEARREVIGQVLDYAKDLSRWTYDHLEAAARVATKTPSLNLYQQVYGQDADPDGEARFIDAVSRNLRLGRVLIIIAGDGIQENAEDLGGFLQRHVGLHFTLAMVEISLWRSPQGGAVFVQPKVVTRTVQIERAVVRLEQGVALEPARIQPASPAARPMTLSGEEFYEGLKAVNPSLPDQLKAFLAEVEPLGVYPDIRRTLTLKWNDPEGRTFPLGAIDREGLLSTDVAHWAASALGRVDLSHAYQARLADLVPGASVRQTPDPKGWRVVLDGRNLPTAKLLDQAQGWKAAIGDYTAQLRALSAAEA